MEGSSNNRRDDVPRRPFKKEPAEHLPSISKVTAEKLFRCPAAVDAIALYVFYLYTAGWQATNRPKATTSFCAGGLGTSVIAIRFARKQLLALGLIEDYVQKDVCHHIRGHYVHVKWIRRPPDHPFDFPPPGATHPMDDPGPKCFKFWNQNASISSNKNAQNPFTPLQGDDEVGFLNLEELTRGLLDVSWSKAGPPSNDQRNKDP